MGIVPHTGILKDEPSESYHSKRDYISSSPLPEMAKSPLHFYEAWTGKPKAATDAMDRGNFIHQIVLEQDIAKYAPRPLNEKGELVRSNSKEYAAFLAANPGKTPIHPDLYGEALDILKSVCANRTFLKAFEASDKEVSFYAKHAETGLFLKARPDMIAKDYSFILDVKSTSDIMKFERQMFSMAYDVRLIHYVETIKALTGNVIPEVYFFAVESKAPYGARLFRLRSDAIEAATIQWTRWLNEISACMEDGVWPGFSEEIVDISRPKYLEVEQEISFEGVG